MLRLCLRTLLLIIVLSAAIFTVRLIGKVQPAPSLFTVIFTNPDGSPCEMPCMFGVRPGKMTADEAIAILRKHPATRNMKESPGSEPWIYYFEAGNVFFMVNLQLERLELQLDTQYSGHGVPPATRWLLDKGTFGDVVSVFGSPRTIRLMDYNPNGTSTQDVTPTALVSYPDKALIFFFRDKLQGNILPDDPLGVVILAPRLGAEPAKTWRGFASISRYNVPTP